MITHIHIVLNITTIHTLGIQGYYMVSFIPKHIKKMDSVDGGIASQLSSDEILELECDPCMYEGVKKDAVIYCYQCQDYLCSSCKSTHQKLSVTRKHQVVPCDSMPRKGNSKTESLNQNIAVKCSCNNKVVKVYCEGHTVVICTDCQKLKHRNCKTSTFDEALAETKQTNKEQTSRHVQELRENVETMREKRSNDLDNLESQTTMCRSNVKEFRQKLNILLDKLEEKALSDIETEKTEQRKHIEQDIDTCRVALSKLNAVFQMFESTPIAEKWLIFIHNMQLAETMEHVQGALKDINDEDTEPKIFFDGDSTVMRADAKSLGTVTTTRLKESRPIIADMAVKSSTKVDLKDSTNRIDPWISGSVFMPSGELVLCFGYEDDNGVKVLNTDFTLKEQIRLPAVPWDIDIMSPVEVVISSPGRKSLTLVKIYPKLQIGSSIRLDQTCRGVVVYNASIYVSFDNGEVRILDRAGKQMKNIYSPLKFNVPYHISVPKPGRLYVSEHYTNTMRLLNNGKEVYSYKHSELHRPLGMYIDGGENVFVCGCHSDNVHIIDKNGKHKTVLLTASDGLSNPYTISFRPSDNSLVVGGIMGLLVFNLG